MYPQFSLERKSIFAPGVKGDELVDRLIRCDTKTNDTLLQAPSAVRVFCPRVLRIYGHGETQKAVQTRG